MTFDSGGRLRPVGRDDDSDGEGSGEKRNRGQGGTGSGPRRQLPNFGGGDGRGRAGGKRPAWLPGAIVAGILALLFLFITATAGLWVNVWWFQSLGLVDVLVTRYSAFALSFLVGFVVALVFLGVNVLFALRAEGGRELSVGGVTLGRRMAAGLFGIGAVVFAGLFALAVASEWEAFLLFFNQVPFGATDAQFGQEIGFYVFTLPVIDFWRGWFVSLIVIAAIAVGLIYFAKFGAEAVSGRFRIPPALRAHASVLGALFLALTAFGYWVETRELVYSTRGVVYGASYTDVNAQLPANYILLVITLVAAAILLVNSVARRLPLFLGAIGVWGVAVVLIGNAYPSAVESITVRPNQREREQQFIERNIAATRAAYGLTNVDVVQFSPMGDPTRADINANRASVENVRLWDYRPLLPSYGQLQQIRQYYRFVDVDVDRYRIDGQYRQVMISGRELDVSKLAPQSQTWQNQHLVYTHGYGAVVSSANQVVGEGSPSFILSNIPPTGPSGLQIAEPRIYYGELPGATYAVVKTRQAEFDPTADAPGATRAVTPYTGNGVPAGGVFEKFVFATYFGDSNILLSSDITGDSQILYRRNVADRLRTVAPFLRYDSDPYLAIVEGKLVWIADAFTTTNRYPYSEPFSDPANKIRGGFNYMRNSVKATVNAYDGSVHLYVADESDPIIRTYRAIYPHLFTPMTEASPALRDRFRYAEDYFDVQTLMYRRYHVTDPRAFYGSEDVWDIAQEQLGTDKSKSQRIESYFVLLRLPGQQTEEFVLVRPFTPGGGQGSANRQNMVSYMVGRSDGTNYGQIISYEFPRQTTIQGPVQVQARINQEPDISREITLLDQSGSQVNLGNFLIVPLGNTILYVEPLYVQATNSPFPQLKRVIVASQNRVVMRPTLDEAINALLGNEPATTGMVGGVAPAAGGAAVPITGNAQMLAAEALAAYQRGQDALRRNDFATYGTEQARLEAILRQLNGTPAAAPAATALPGATATARP